MRNNRNKLLFLAPQNPYPSTDGGKISIYYPVKYLSKYFEIYFITPVKYMDEKTKIAIKHFEGLGVKYIPVIKNTDDKIIDLFKNIFLKIPFKWYKYYSKDIYDLSEKLITTENIKYVLTSAPHMALYSVKLKKKYPNLKIFLREHNIEFSLVEHFIKFTKNILYKLIGKWQLRKTRNMEQKYWEIFDNIFFISDFDYEIAKKIKSDLTYKFNVLYDGFELNRDCKENNYKYTFILPTNVKSPQNQVSLKWFIEKIWIPSLEWLKQNNLNLSITGGSKDEWTKVLGNRDLDSLNIRILGFVENIDNEFCKYKYALSPTVFGSGIRLKILHAMALGKVVFASRYDVSTATVFKDMDNIVEFETPDEFISKIIKIENNQLLYKSLSNRAVETVKDYFSWDKYAEAIFNKYIEEKKYDENITSW